MLLSAFMFDDGDDATVMVPTFGPGSFFADRYRIDALLGSGAMGRVYAATELHSDRRVALKILHKERLGEADTVERFSREAEVLASIGHPGIVEVYTFHHTSDGTPYLAMELLEGVTLKTRLTNAGRFEDPRDFQAILDGVCGALSAAHARGIVHRDMKPDNVFLPATGMPRAKLVDFGLSRMGAMKKGLTHSGMILGTPRYMAPEQIRDAATAGPPVDIYSAGILIYESLSGQSPYPGQDYGQLLGCVLEGRTTPFEQVRPDLPRGIGDVIRRAMDPDPSKRFASCAELADAYGAAIGSPSGRSRLGAQSAQAPKPQRRIAAHQNVVGAKGSTLAFDVSALEMLPDVPDVAPVLAAHAQHPPAQHAAQHAPAQHAPVQYPPVQRAPVQHAPQPHALRPPASPQQAQGGDTLFIPTLESARPPSSGAAYAMPSSALAPQPVPAMHPPGPAHTSQAPPALMSYAGPRPPMSSQAPPAAGFAGAQPEPPPAKKSRGLLLFFVAMVVVIILSAAGGFGLRAYMRGELVIPGVSARR